MNISRFFGSTSREAMRQVRMALGPDAMIVSNRRVNGGVEIMAADATALPAAEPLESSGAVASAANGQSMPTYSGLNRAAPVQQPRIELMGAIGAMQGALESRIDELLWSHQLQRTPEMISLFQSLLGYGFSTTLLRAMLKRLPPQLTGRLAFEWVRNELDTHLPVLSSEDILWQPGCALALVGPTGVGKTTTIAKLAARCVKRFGADKLVLITTDTYRIGAHEQLKIYADILRVPVHVVQDAQTLRQVMLGIRPEQVVLIDNVGISQRDSYVKEQAALLAGSGRRIQRLLALNASSHGDTLDEVARAYKTDGGIPLIGCIITKIDETSRIGPALDTAIRYQMPIHYVSDGQKVPENLRFLSAKQLVDKAFAPEPHNARALFSPTAGDVAALLAAASPEDSRSVSQTQRNEMLSKMLMASAGPNGPTVDQLRVQTAALDECLSLSSAFEYWRYLQTLPAVLPDVVQQGEALLRSAKHEINHNPDVPALCVYQSARTSKGNEVNQQLVAGYICGADGAILSSPQQQLVTATEWLSTSGHHVLASSSKSEHIKHAIAWAEQHHQGLAMMHAFDGGTASLWQELAASGSDFLAVVPASTRFWHQTGTTTAKTLARQLQFNAVSDLHTILGFTKVAGASLGEVGLWIAREPIELRKRNRQTLHLELVCLRVVNRYSNEIIRDQVVLLHAPTLACTDATLAGWLVTQAELKLTSRLVAAAWPITARWQAGQGLSLAYQARAAALFAAAASNAMLLSRQQSLRHLLLQLLPNRATLTAPRGLESLLRLFALKEVLQ